MIYISLVKNYYSTNGETVTKMKILNPPYDFDINILTSIRTVGKIDFLCFPTCVDEIMEAFIYAKNNNLKPYILGGGSNSLIGYCKKTLIISDRYLSSIWDVKDDCITVSSNIYINKFVSQSNKINLYGLEFLEGIPAHLGGMLCMNAGAYEQNISDYVQWITIVDETGERMIEKNDIDFGYRKISIKTVNNHFFISKICLKLSKNLPKMNYLKQREINHPMNVHSLGCFFKNPENNHAGYLIEKAGLKSFQIGGAMVSSKHANFLINKGNAKFEDFIELINHVKKTVLTMFNINLELEIRIVNE